MRVVMIMVTSVNGKITRGDNPDVSAFSSKEDAQLFASFKSEFPVIIMGSGTYEVARAKIILSPKTLRIVMTRNPKKYTSVPGQLEFTSESPKELIMRLKKAGIKKVMLAGGAEINALFLKDRIVDELRLTIEPVLLGEGKNLFSETILDVPMKLNSIKKLNAIGSLHMIYEVIK